MKFSAQPALKNQNSQSSDLSAASRMAARDLNGFFEAIKSYSASQNPSSSTNSTKTPKK